MRTKRSSTTPKTAQLPDVGVDAVHALAEPLGDEFLVVFEALDAFADLPDQAFGVGAAVLEPRHKDGRQHERAAVAAAPRPDAVGLRSGGFRSERIVVHRAASVG